MDADVSKLLLTFDDRLLALQELALTTVGCGLTWFIKELGHVILVFLNFAFMKESHT